MLIFAIAKGFQDMRFMQNRVQFIQQKNRAHLWCLANLTEEYHGIWTEGGGYQQWASLPYQQHSGRLGQISEATTAPGVPDSAKVR